VDEPLEKLTAADLKSLFTHIDSISTIIGNDPLHGRTFECYSAVQWISHTGLLKESEAKIKQDTTCSLNCKASSLVVSTRILSQIPSSLTKLPSNTWWGWLAPHLYGMRHDNHLAYFMNSQLPVFLRFFNFFYIIIAGVSYWNQTDILHWQ
jgi:hypothetical protein